MVSVFGKLGRLDWRLLIVVGAVALALSVFLGVRAMQTKAAERERHLLAEISNLQGQVAISENLVMVRATRVKDLTRTLEELYGKNSELVQNLDRRIEEAVASAEVRVEVREVIRYRSTPQQTTAEGPPPTVTITPPPEDSPDAQENHRVEFDMTQQGFRVSGFTESLGPVVELDLEQVDPFVLRALLTRQRRSGEWDLFVEDPEGRLSVEINNVMVQDNYGAPRLVERLGVGGDATVFRNGQSTASVHGSLDIGSSFTVRAGPSINNDGHLGGSLGLTWRPFAR